MGHRRPLFIYVCVFKQALQSSQQINVKNVNLVHGAGIRSQDLFEHESPLITTTPWLLILV